MARADLLCELIKCGVLKDEVGFRRAAEAICAEERSKQHEILANRIGELLAENRPKMDENRAAPRIINSSWNAQKLIIEKMPTKRLSQIQLSENNMRICSDFIEEQTRSDLLRSYGLEPRNKLLLLGPPGNGKTSLAEAIAESLMVPLITVRYDAIIGAYLGETAARLSKLFEYAKTRQCVLFFDEFDTIGKERGDQQETGEIKRVVSSLLLQIDALPSYVVVIAATNHENLLDKAVWRRFQIKLEMPMPTRTCIERWISVLEKKYGFSFGLEASTLARKMTGKSYAEIEEFALSVYRKYILTGQPSKIRTITNEQLRLLGYQEEKM